MNPQSPEPNSDPLESSPGVSGTPESVTESYQELKQELEYQARALAQLRSNLQPLVFGLIMMVALTICTAGWFAYRLMLQERREQADMQMLMDAEQLRIAEVQQFREQLESQQQQLQGLQQQIPAEFITLTDTVQSNSRQLQLLRDRVLQTEALVQTLLPPPSPTPTVIPSPPPDPNVTPEDLPIGPAFQSPIPQSTLLPSSTPPPVPQITPSSLPSPAPSPSPGTGSPDPEE